MKDREPRLNRRDFLAHLPEITVGIVGLAGAAQLVENTDLATDVELLKERQSATEMAVEGNNNLAYRLNVLGDEVAGIRHDVNVLVQGETVLFDRTKRTNETGNSHP